MSLGNAGYAVLEAGNAQEGLAVLDAQGDRIDVVLTDIEMPVMDGYEFLEHRHGNERLKAIPFIVISGVEEMASIIACIKLGAEYYLPKPFDPVLLHARIGACVENKRMTDELRDLNDHLAERVDEKVREVERLTMLRRFVSPSWPRRLPAVASRSWPAIVARSRCCSVTCAGSRRSRRRPNPRRSWPCCASSTRPSAR